MAPPFKNPRGPHLPEFDVAFERERSDVRLREEQAPSSVRRAAGPETAGRTAGAAPLTRQPRATALPPPLDRTADDDWGGMEDVVERNQRIRHKMSLAAVLLGRLPPDDRRARLLRSAILRRDEVLLDALLSR